MLSDTSLLPHHKKTDSKAMALFISMATDHRVIVVHTPHKRGGADRTANGKQETSNMRKVEES